MFTLTLMYVVKLLVAMTLGTLIGLERQWRQRRAGLRTNALVALGAALFVLINDDMMGQSGDPMRMAAQVVSGIGFLGAGVIMRDGLSVRGLNTAATLWCSAAVGMMAGFGLLLKASLGTVAVLLTNVALRALADKINRRPTPESEKEYRYEVTAKCSNREEAHIRHLILQAVSAGPLVLKELESIDVIGSDRTEVIAKIESSGKQHLMMEQLVGRLGIEPGIFAIAWRVALGGEEV